MRGIFHIYFFKPTGERAHTRTLRFFYLQGFSPELPPDSIGFKELNNSVVSLSASIVRSESNVLHITTLDRDIKLEGKAMDTPYGWGYLGIGSLIKG